MKRPGEPLRFLIIIICGWMLLRLAMLRPGVPPTALVQSLRFRAPAATPYMPMTPFKLNVPAHAAKPTMPVRAAAPRPKYQQTIHQWPHADPIRTERAPAAVTTFTETIDDPGKLDDAAIALSADFPASLGPQAPSTTHWSASFWMIARDGRGIGAGLATGQIGGSQAGGRLAYALGSARRVALVGRFATPLVGGGKEGAIGVEWRPTRLPVRLIAEQRLAVDGTGSGPAIGIVGGFGPTDIPYRFRLEGYGQAGVIKRRQAIGYADGAVRLNRQIAKIEGATLDLGLGGWGAIQPGAARLDLGPSIGLRLPIRSEHIRLALDWRQRVAGNARPGSGPALSIGADF